jgi:hypothetical protein
VRQHDDVTGHSRREPQRLIGFQPPGRSAVGQIDQLLTPIDVVDGHIKAIWAVRNPDKLAHL